MKFTKFDYFSIVFIVIAIFLVASSTLLLNDEKKHSNQSFKKSENSPKKPINTTELFGLPSKKNAL